MAEQGERGPLWIVADMQTGGRGRLGRRWVSEPGNLYATFLFAIADGPAVAAQVSFVAALAVHDCVTTLRPGASAAIKWPNDVLIDGAKVSGVLPEVVATAPTRIAVGCGINVAHAPDVASYPATALGEDVGVTATLAALDASLTCRLRDWDEGRGFAVTREAWSARAMGLGQAVVASHGTNRISGTFTGLAEDGARIVLQPDGRTAHVHAGEVRFAALDTASQRR